MNDVNEKRHCTVDQGVRDTTKSCKIATFDHSVDNPESLTLERATSVEWDNLYLDECRNSLE